MVDAAKYKKIYTPYLVYHYIKTENIMLQTNIYYLKNIYFPKN